MGSRHPSQGQASPLSSLQKGGEFVGWVGNLGCIGLDAACAATGCKPDAGTPLTAPGESAFHGDCGRLLRIRAPSTAGLPLGMAPDDPVTSHRWLGVREAIGSGTERDGLAGSTIQTCFLSAGKRLAEG